MEAAVSAATHLVGEYLVRGHFSSFFFLTQTPCHFAIASILFCTIFNTTQQKELKEKNLIVLGSNALEALQTLMQRVKERKLKGRVILLCDDDIIPNEAG